MQRTVLTARGRLQYKLQQNSLIMIFQETREYADRYTYPNFDIYIMFYKINQIHRLVLSGISLRTMYRTYYKTLILCIIYKKTKIL